MEGKTILELFDTHRAKKVTRRVFLLGIAGIPHNAKSACNRATSDKKPENSEQDNSQIEAAELGESFKKTGGNHA